MVVFWPTYYFDDRKWAEGLESVKVRGLNLEDQDQPMKKQDEFVSSILGYPKKDISEGEPDKSGGPKEIWTQEKILA